MLYYVTRHMIQFRSQSKQMLYKFYKYEILNQSGEEKEQTHVLNENKALHLLGKKKFVLSDSQIIRDNLCIK